MIQYKIATFDDAETLANARISLLDEDSGLSGEARDALHAKTLTYMRDATRAGTWLAFLAFEDGELVGTAGATLYETLPGIKLPNGKNAYIQNVYVAPQHRRGGVGRELIRCTVAESQARGFTRITLSATEKGAALFRTCGFEFAPHVGLLEMEYKAN